MFMVEYIMEDGEEKEEKIERAKNNELMESCVWRCGAKKSKMNLLWFYYSVTYMLMSCNKALLSFPPLFRCFGSFDCNLAVARLFVSLYTAKITKQQQNCIDLTTKRFSQTFHSIITSFRIPIQPSAFRLIVLLYFRFPLILHGRSVFSDPGVFS